MNKTMYKPTSQNMTTWEKDSKWEINKWEEISGELPLPLKGRGFLFHRTKLART